MTWPTWSTGAWAAARLPRSSVRPGREARTDSLGLFVLDRPRLSKRRLSVLDRLRLSKRRLSVLDRPGLPCLLQRVPMQAPMQAPACGIAPFR